VRGSTSVGEALVSHVVKEYGDTKDKPLNDLRMVTGNGDTMRKPFLQDSEMVSPCWVGLHL
jgi:hypothetical protein